MDGEFLHMPNGYAQTPLLFTKLLKQPFGSLRKHGYASVIYIDDSYLQGGTYAHCLENIHATHNLLVSSGFSVNQDKSVLQPAQRIVFLGYALDSPHMSICLSDKRGVILDICKKLNSGASHKIRAVASAVSCLIAALPGVKYGGLFYRSLERCKNLALKSAGGNFEKTWRLTTQAQHELGWWSHCITLASHFLLLGWTYFLMPVWRDGVALMALPMLGGGGLMMNPLSTSMSWSSMQPNSPCWLLPQMCHTPISTWYWTTLWLLLTLIKWGSYTPPFAMRLLVYIALGKGRKHVAVYCLHPGRWEQQIFIPGIFGTILNGCLTLVFKQLSALSFVPEVDLFTSRLNCQLTPFVSWKPEPGAWAVNAFSLCWTALEFYDFPPMVPQGCWWHHSGPPNRGSHSFWSCWSTTHNCSSPRKTFPNWTGGWTWFIHCIQCWLSRWQLYQGISQGQAYQ